MKRFLFLGVLAIGFLTFPLPAQDSTGAAAIAEKQEAEERYKRMSADVESLLAANLSLQKKISALETEVQKLREEQSRAANNNTANESVKRLAETVQEVDKKREADKQLILEEFSRFRKTLSSTPTPPSIRVTPKVSVPDTSSTPEKGFTHVVESGETLGKIVLDYNAAFKAKGMKTVTQKQVMDANPSVNWNKLKIGQKVFVPAPAE